MPAVPTTVQHFIYPLSTTSGYSFDAGAITPENYWQAALAGEVDEWGLSTGYQLIQPGDWVWAYFSLPRGQVLGVGTVVQPVGWNDSWGCHSVFIQWDRKLTAALKVNPINYSEYRQQVQQSSVRAKPETIRVLERWLRRERPTATTLAADVKFAERSVIQRLGQPEFRTKALNGFQGACAITRCSVAGTLQAAHVIAVGKGGNHSVDNCLLLRADIHNLFDLGLITVNAKLLVRVADVVTEPGYRALDGVRIPVPLGASRPRFLKALADHRDLHSR